MEGDGDGDGDADGGGNGDGVGDVRDAGGRERGRGTRWTALWKDFRPTWRERARARVSGVDRSHTDVVGESSI